MSSQLSASFTGEMHLEHQSNSYALTFFSDVLKDVLEVDNVVQAYCNDFEKLVEDLLVLEHTYNLSKMLIIDIKKHTDKGPST